MTGNLIYLASPYSHPSKDVVTKRFNDVCVACAKLMKMGIHIYSPIAHTHPVAMVGELPTSWDYWKVYDTKMLSACDELWVLTLDGWEESKGIAGEIEIMKEFNKPIWHISPNHIYDDRYMIHRYVDGEFMAFEYQKV